MHLGSYASCAVGYDLLAHFAVLGALNLNFALVFLADFATAVTLTAQPQYLGARTELYFVAAR